MNHTLNAATRPMRHRAMRFAAVLAAGALALAACSSSSGSPSDRADSAGNNGEGGGPIRVAIAPTGTALPVVVADKQGYFKEAGLDVTYQVSNVTISDQLATLGNQFEVAMGTQPALLTATQQGIQIVNITGGALDTKDNPQADFVVSAASGIKSYADMEGKTLGSLSLTGNIHYSLLNAAKKAGVDLDSINWVVGTVPQLPDSLKAGRVQGIEEIQPFASFAVAAGGQSIGDPFRSIGDKAYLGVFLADKDWANQNEEQVLKFNSALAKAADWLADNTDEARKLLGSYSGAPEPVLAKTPIPTFEFQTTAAELKAEQGADTAAWIDILKSVAGFQSDLEPSDVLPEWAN